MLKMVRYGANAQNVNLSYTAQNHSSKTILKDFAFRWQINVNTEF